MGAGDLNSSAEDDSGSSGGEGTSRAGWGAADDGRYGDWCLRRAAQGMSEGMSELEALLLLAEC